MAEVEHTVKVLTLDGSLQEEIKRLETEGWELVPGVLPVVVYHLVRLKETRPSPAAVQGGLGKLVIDESKVMILRDGKLIQ